MASFPIAWDDGISDQAIPSAVCPYSTEEIQEYLRNCQHHYALQEPPLGFQAAGPILFRQEIGRNYWLFSAVDDLERQWFIVVGSGTSPFNPGMKIRRWMYAELNELSQMPDEFMDHAYTQQLIHDTRDDH
ncbi:MAG: hypothetical protein ABSB77_24665 [Xanthobacteraceae bacterium]|jgi:hypothetical protein